MLKLHQFAQLLHLTKACLKQNILRFASAIPYQNLGCEKKNPFFFSQPRFWKGILNFQTLQAVDGLNSRNRWELKLRRTRKKLGLSR